VGKAGWGTWSAAPEGGRLRPWDRGETNGSAVKEFGAMDLRGGVRRCITDRVAGILR